MSIPTLQFCYSTKSSLTTPTSLILVPLLTIPHIFTILRLLLQRSSTLSINITSQLLKSTATATFLSILILTSSSPLGDLDCLRTSGTYYENAWSISAGGWKASTSIPSIILGAVCLFCDVIVLLVAFSSTRQWTTDRRLIFACLITIFFTIGLTLRKISTETAPNLFSTLLMFTLQATTLTLAIHQHRLQLHHSSMPHLSCTSLILQTLSYLILGLILGVHALHTTEILDANNQLQLSSSYWPLLIPGVFFHLALYPFILCGSNMLLLRGQSASWGRNNSTRTGSLISSHNSNPRNNNNDDDPIIPTTSIPSDLQLIHGLQRKLLTSIISHLKKGKRALKRYWDEEYVEEMEVGLLDLRSDLYEDDSEVTREMKMGTGKGLRKGVTESLDEINRRLDGL